MLAWLQSVKWMGAAAAASLLAAMCAGGWARAVIVAHVELEAAVTARDAMWRAQIASANARAAAEQEALQARIMRATDAERAATAEQQGQWQARTQALEEELAKLKTTDPVVYPAALAKRMRR